MSPDFYFFQALHSEVTSTTHTSALKCFRKDAQRFSTFIRPEVRTAKCRFYAHTFPRISSSAFLLLVWHLTTSALHLSASSTAQRTILWDTVFVKSTIRSGLPICLTRDLVLSKNFCFAVEPLAYLFILTYHSVMAAYDNNTHIKPPDDNEKCLCLSWLVLANS